MQSEAATRIRQLAEVLNRVPREMLLIFKTNDLLRSIARKLGIESNALSFVHMSKSCTRAVFDERQRLALSRWQHALLRISCWMNLFLLSCYESYLRLRYYSSFP